MKYWHELPQKKIDELLSLNIKIGEVLKKYKQPSWCHYPDALAGKMGCWSLTHNRKNGLRTKISHEFCKSCDEYKPVKQVL